LQTNKENKDLRFRSFSNNFVRLAKMRLNHRYLRKIVYSRHISLRKILSNNSASSWDTTAQAGQQGSWARAIYLPNLPANIFVSASTEVTFFTRQEVRAICQSIFNVMSMDIMK
jgi:hypothetical protein